MTATVADIVKALEEIAPERLAESWDNTGLQAGEFRWPVRRVMIALDPSFGVMKHAAKMSADMLITHHPLIFSPLKSIDLATPTGRVIAEAIRSSVAVYAVHTNLDSAADGLNDMLAECLALENSTVMAPKLDSSEGAEESIQTGLGRIGDLPEPTDLPSLCRVLKSVLGLETVRVAGCDPGRVSRVAVCTGSGSSLLDVFFKSGADVYITGDVRYHDARDAEDRQRALVDIGHFGSEHIMVARLRDRLDRLLADRYPGVEVIPCEVEKDPFSVA